jgi:hypothetical protein
MKRITVRDREGLDSLEFSRPSSCLAETLQKMASGIENENLIW